MIHSQPHADQRAEIRSAQQGAQVQRVRAIRSAHVQSDRPADAARSGAPDAREHHQGGHQHRDGVAADALQRARRFAEAFVEGECSLGRE